MFHAVNNELVRFDVAAINVKRDSYTPRNPYATGYGKRIPTSYRVRVFDNKWRRVYCVCYSNVGTCYIVSKGVCYIVNI